VSGAGARGLAGGVIGVATAVPPSSRRLDRCSDCAARPVSWVGRDCWGRAHVAWPGLQGEAMAVPVHTGSTLVLWLRRSTGAGGQSGGPGTGGVLRGVSVLRRHGRRWGALDSIGAAPPSPCPGWWGAPLPPGPCGIRGCWSLVQAGLVMGVPSGRWKSQPRVAGSRMAVQPWLKLRLWRPHPPRLLAWSVGPPLL
jgi:hypothetical protein